MDLKKHIRSIPDYPKKGILFRDITTLIKNPEAFKFTNDKIIELSNYLCKKDLLIGVENEKFLFDLKFSNRLLFNGEIFMKYLLIQNLF